VRSGILCGGPDATSATDAKTEIGGMSGAPPDDRSLAGLTGEVVLVGAGRMGGALLQGWLRLGLAPQQAVVFEPQPSAELLALTQRGLRLNPGQHGLDAAAVVIAVKPQSAEAVVPPLARLIVSRTVLISIMAGRTLAGLARLLPQGAALVRAMPNTPAAIGRGITVAVAQPEVQPAQRALADRLLGATGAVEWVEDEGLLDAVTAVSGSGPAYVFLLAEELARAGEAAGLPAALAARLARATVAGAGELLHRSDLDPALLRQNVTSPGGTTAAALAVLMAPDGLGRILREAVAAATRRSRELAG
jgi:pyrroline-5-carboxylate reductase